MFIGDGHQPNSKGLYTPYKDARVLGRSWNSPNGHICGRWTMSLWIIPPSWNVCMDKPVPSSMVSWWIPGYHAFGRSRKTYVYRIPVTQMGPLVLIGKDLLVEATAQVVWFVKPSAVFSRFYWMIGGFGMMIIFRTRQVKKHEKSWTCWFLLEITKHLMEEDVPSLKLSYPLKINGWKVRFPFRIDYFQGQCNFRSFKLKKKNLLLDSVQGAVGWFSGKNIIYRRTLCFLACKGSRRVDSPVICRGKNLSHFQLRSWVGQGFRRQSGLKHFLFHPFWLILHTSPKGCRNSNMVIERCDANLWCTVPVVAGTFRILLQSCFEGCSGRECQKQSPWFFEVYGVFGLELKRFLHLLPEVLHKMLMLQMPTWSVPTHFKGDVLTKPYSLKGCVVLPSSGTLKGQIQCNFIVKLQHVFGWNLNPKHLEVATWPSQAYSMESKRIQLNATQTLVMLVNKHTPNAGWWQFPNKGRILLTKWPVSIGHCSCDLVSLKRANLLNDRDLNLKDSFPYYEFATWKIATKWRGKQFSHVTGIIGI